jgi:hypothetical protein
MVLFAGGEGSLQLQCTERPQLDDWAVNWKHAKQNDNSVKLQEPAESPPLWKFSKESIGMQSMMLALATAD